MILKEGLLIDGVYRIGPFIAKGGMAEVWLAEQVTTGRKVALKILSRRSLAHVQIVQRFELEYDILKKLDHPNIIRAYDYGHYVQGDARLPWYTMDYYPKTFRQRLAQVSVGEGIRLLLPTLDALNYSHNKKILHRDLKPVNILVSEDGRSVLSDFGIAKDLDSNANLTGRAIIGTITYMSPEQCLGQPISTASDIYSLGIMLYQLCAGRLPFNDDNDYAVIQMHLRETPPDIRSLNSAISERLNAAVMKCLAKEPAARFRSALELKLELMRCPELKESIDRILKPGELLLDRYRVISLIEQGGFSEVYRVKDIRTGAILALKILLPALMYDEESVRRFDREIRILRNLDHPNILKIIDDGHHAYQMLQLPYFIMPFFTGNLGSSMSEPVDPDKAFLVMMDVLDALAFAHNADPVVIHRDLKPSNVLIDSQGRGVLTDFGIAKMSKRLTELATKNATMTRATIGTATYMAPEQIRNDPLDARADIYSIGVILYEIAAGRRPFDAKSSELITAMHLYEQPPPPSTYNPDISPALEAIILKCLEKTPNRRYKDVPELISALKAARYRGKWFGVGTRLLHPTTIVRMTRRSLRTPAPYIGLGVAALTFIIGASSAVAYRSNKLGLPENNRVDFRYYSAPAVSETLRRRENLAHMGAGAFTVAEKFAPKTPPEFLLPRDAKSFERLLASRADAATSGDLLLAAKADSRLNRLLESAPSPRLQINILKTPSVIPTNQESTDFQLWFENTALAGLSGKFNYDFAIYSGDEAAADRKKLEVKSALAGSAETGDLRIEFSGLAPGKYAVELAGLFTSPGSGAAYETKMNPFIFDILKVDRPVNIAVADPGRRWSLQNEPVNGQVFETWEWTLKNAQSGEEIPAPDSSRNGDLILTDEFIESIKTEGRYHILARARDAKADFAHESFASGQLSVVVDHTPPTLAATIDGADAPDGARIVLFPTDNPAIISLAGADQWAEELRYLNGETPLEDSRIEIRWRNPGSERADHDELTLQARDPSARPAAALSTPVKIHVTSLGRQTVALLQNWSQAEQSIAAAPDNYRRAQALAPLGDLAGALGQGGVDRSWLVANLADASAFDSLEQRIQRRLSLKEADDRLLQRRALFERIIAKSDAARRDAISAKLQELAGAWTAQTDDSLSPESWLKPVESELLPPAPDDVIEVVRDDRDPLNSKIRLLPDFAAKFNAQYRYDLVTKAPEPDTDLEKILTKGQINQQKVFPVDKADDLIRPQYLILQTWLEDAESKLALASPPRVITIKPIFELDAKTLGLVDTITQTLEAAQSDKSGKYERTLAWVDQRQFPFMDSRGSGLRADMLWVLRNGADAAAMNEFKSAAESIQALRAGDEKFETALSTRVKTMTTGWLPEKRDAAADLIAKEWRTKPADTDPERFAQSAFRGFISNAAQDILEPPSLDAPGAELLRLAAPPGQAPQIKASAIKGLDREALALAYGKDGDLPEASAPGFQFRGKGDALTLDPPPAGAKKLTLAMRYEREADGVRLRSKWAPLAEIEIDEGAKPAPANPGPANGQTDGAQPQPQTPMSATGVITGPEAKELARRILEALPKAGAPKNESAFNAYKALFKPGMATPANSDLLKNYTTGATAGPIMDQISRGNSRFLSLEARGLNGNLIQMILTLKTQRSSSTAAYVFEVEPSTSGWLILSDKKQEQAK